MSKVGSKTVSLIGTRRRFLRDSIYRKVRCLPKRYDIIVLNSQSFLRASRERLTLPARTLSIRRLKHRSPPAILRSGSAQELLDVEMHITFSISPACHFDWT